MTDDLKIEDTSVEVKSYFDSDAYRWQGVLEHSDFRDTLELVDTIFVDEGLEPEMHVGVNAVNDVRYESFAVPRTLDLMIAETYESFMDEVSNRFFQGMGPEDYRRPPDSNVEIGFGSYTDVFEVDAGFEALDVGVPTDQSFNDEVLTEFYGENGFDGVEAAVTHRKGYGQASNPYVGNL